jgi:hypothetical protein
MRQARSIVVGCLVFTAASVRAGVGDPQVRTDHAWYPGELACSTFERLFATQAEVYHRVVGVEPRTDEQKALASWLWRNTHYYHGEDGREDLWGKGFSQEGDRSREYWTGLFAFGFGLCGTTHDQWSAEMEQLLGHARSRSAGVAGHTSFEVFLTGGAYGPGRWALLDHDISSVIYDGEGKGLLSIAQIKADLKRLTDRRYTPERQHGWVISGLHPDDAPGAFSQFDSVAYLSGYAGPLPSVHLRRGETLRRYLQPGLEDGKTFVFWGRNYNTGGIPGPERDRTWVNQPERMYRSRDGVAARAGQARHGNAVYTYRPDFAGGDYREGIVDEDAHQVTFAFQTPYVIGATPPSAQSWGIYEPGCKNGLVLHGRARCPVAVSVDRGTTWEGCGRFVNGMDLTDHVKGRRQYFLRLGAPARDLADADLTMRTVCQANAAVLPRLKDNGSRVRFEASGQAVLSAGPTIGQARAHLIAGAFGSPDLTLEVATPHREPVRAVFGAAHMASGNPPSSDVRYHIDYSVDGGKTWQPVVRDWTIPHRGEEPGDFWSQSFCHGSADIAPRDVSSVRIRFGNTGHKACLRAEAHLVYRVSGEDRTRVTFDWTDDQGDRRESHVFDKPAEWDIKTGKNVQTRWVEFEPVGAK